MGICSGLCILVHLILIAAMVVTLGKITGTSW